MITDKQESGYIKEYDLESGEELAASLSPTCLDEKSIRDVVDSDSLRIASNIIASNDPDEVNNYLEQFNLNMSKKNLLRLLKMNELWDKVSDEALDRLENHPDELTHAELINYIKVTQEAINNNKKSSDQTATASPITLNQQNNTVNVNVDSSDNVRIDRRSKEKIMEAVSKLLNISLDNIPEDTIDVIEEPVKENE